MAPHEARNFAGYQDPKAKKKEEGSDLGGGSNMAHAKLAAAWTRRLHYLLKHYNILLVLIRHQNDKVDMGAGGGSFISADVQASFNDTSIGGKAFKQSAAYRMILSHMKFDTATIGGVKEKIARICKMNVIKNTFAPLRATEYTLMMVPFRDQEKTWEQPISFDHQLPHLLAQSRLLNVQVHNQKCFSCRELNLIEVDAYTFANAFYANHELLSSVAMRLGIQGYGPLYVTPEYNPVINSELRDLDPSCDPVEAAEAAESVTVPDEQAK
jgi:hypothetical protein